MSSNAEEQFISEPIDPQPGAFAPELMRTGLAALPQAFVWRGRHYQVVECLAHRKVSSREGGRALGELYLRRQEFVVRLDTDQIARLYVERHARPGVSREIAKKRWFLYSITSSGV